MSSSFDQRFKAVIREIQLHKTGVVISGVLISLLFLGVGLLMPKNYESTSLLYGDQTNVLEPILGSTTPVNDIKHAEIAKEIINTRRFIDLVVKKSEVIDSSLSKVAYERELSKVRSRIEVRSKGPSYIQIAYVDTDPERSFSFVNALVEEFITETAAAKKQESRMAYEFIEGQVKAYKAQLESADQRLKTFQSDNRDGTRETVTGRIAQLQAEVERLKLDIDEAQIKSRTINGQVAAESKFVKQRNQSQSLRKRIAVAQQRLDTLLLSFTDTHPDVVSLRAQISDMENGVVQQDIQNLSGLGSSSDQKGVLNPLYEELRKAQSETRVKVQTGEKRLKATELLLEKEYERLQRIVAREAELSELTRDYDSTQGFYEEMLGSLEKARMTMTLDAEDQGISYKIQEPPVFPLLPKGLRLSHMMILGPLLAVLIPIGLLFLYIELDSRVRMASVIHEQMRVPVLGVVPHVTTKLRQSIFRADLIPHIFAILCVIALYIGVAVYRLAV